MFRRRNENVDQLLSWVMEGVSCDLSANQKFEVDGRPYVFSALRPEPAPAGSLHLRTFNMTLLNVLVCGALVLLGLLFLRSKLTMQLAAALAALAALFFTGVFFPLVTEHLFSEAFLLTAVLVGLTWLIFDLIRWFRGLHRERTEFQASRVQPADLVTNEGASIPASDVEAVDDPPRHSNDGEGGVQ